MGNVLLLRFGDMFRENSMGFSLIAVITNAMGADTCRTSAGGPGGGGGGGGTACCPGIVSSVAGGAHRPLATVIACSWCGPWCSVQDIF